MDVETTAEGIHAVAARCAGDLNCDIRLLGDGLADTRHELDVGFEAVLAVNVTRTDEI